LNEGYIMPERIEFMPCEFILSLSRTRAHTHININIYTGEPETPDGF